MLEGGLNYADLSACTLTPFPARHFRNARVVWLNHRWMIQAGLQTSDPEVERVVSNWLIDTFGVSVPYPPHDPETDYIDDSVSLSADRYGSTGGAAHGGSGRCGVKFGLNAKGIGATPLVSSSVDWYHSHGCMWLEEAIRETVCSELAELDIEKGAVPVIAIIDTGAPVHWGGGETGQRRAIIVRPNFIRLSHLQRSIFFGTSGFDGSDQQLDAQRTHEVASALWGASHKREELAVLAESPLESALSVSEQIGYCHFHRLWPGPFYSSNCEIDGKLVDFGSFRSVPSWRRFYGDKNADGFGAEIPAAVAAYASLQPMLARAEVTAPSTHRLISAMNSRARRSFCDQFKKSLSPAQVTNFAALEHLTQEIVNYYQREQTKPADPDSPGDSLHTFVVAARDPDDSAASILAEKIKKGVKEICGDSNSSASRYAACLASLSRHLHPRDSLCREKLLAKALGLVSSRNLGRPRFNELVSRFISKKVGTSRRVWSDLPVNLIVVAQRCWNDCSYALCRDSGSNQFYLWIEGTKHGDLVRVFGRDLAYSDFAATDLSSNPSRVRIVKPHGNVTSLAFTADLNGIVLRFPRPDFFY